MRKLVAAVVLGLSALAVCPATTALAEDPPANADAAKFEGSYAIVNATEAQAAVEAAIEALVSEMNFIKRPFARSKLRKTNALLTSIRMQFSADQVTYTYNAGHAIRTTLNGPAVRWKSPADDEHYQVTTTLKGQRFTQTFRGSDGTKQEIFDLSADGRTIAYQVVVTSPQLPRPLRYGYSFKRK